MALNKESNGYVITFSVVLVLVVSVLLVTVFSITKDRISQNQKLEKMQNILAATNIQVDRDAAEAAYNETIVDAFALTETGEVQLKGDKEAIFNIDLAKELSKPEGEKLFPVFVASKNDSTFYILGMRGKGLWDAIWGYVSLQSDMKTVYNASFDHKGETAGLGAEIKESWFTQKFTNKKIVNENGEFVSVSVIKKGTAPASEYNVDGISGGTLTSDGLSAMLKMFFSAFYEYSKKVANNNPVIENVDMPVDSLTTDSLSADIIQDGIDTLSASTNNNSNN
ncbi:MAG TPA: NADH:ubiquinone reductase (Na(+)-transporting) subunit C [Bacteroidia bacterium]